MVAARRAEKEIQAGEYRGPLHGVPIAVKDLCYTKGVRTMGGLKILAGFVPDYDATVVAKLNKAGAVMLGKLNMTEGAIAGYHRDFDIPVNPWGEDLWTGVSSSGSGVATAAGLCFASLGSDTGGSIRMPAAANGIVGLKPTYGRVSRFGILPLAESLDHVGPLTRSTKDAAVVFEAIAGFDANDPTSLRDPVPNMLDAIAGGIEGLLVGFDREYSDGIEDPGLVASIEAALGTLEQMGVEIVEVKLPAAPADAHVAIVQREAHDAHQEHYATRAAEYGLFAGEFIGMGGQVTEGQYSEALGKRQEYAAEILSLYSDVDAIVMPGGRMPYPIPSRTQYGGMEEVEQATPWPAQFMIPANMAGTPTLSLTCGFSEAGLPYTMQLMGDRLREPLLCRIGHTYEEVTEWHERHPAV